MKTLLTIAATVALCAASPAAAKFLANGASLNAMNYNGVYLNRIFNNAMTLNGRYLNRVVNNAMTFNGHNLNRIINNAMTVNGQSRNGSLGTFLGSTELISVELPRTSITGGLILP